MLSVQQTLPILRIVAIAKAREPYVGFLGFRVDWEKIEPGSNTVPAYP